MGILIRILVVGLILTILVLIVQKIRGPKILRTPALWRGLSKRHDDLSEALRLRRAIGVLILRQKKAHQAVMPAEVDAIIEALILLVLTRERQGVVNQTDESAQMALDQLKSIYTQFLEESRVHEQNRMDLVQENLRNAAGSTNTDNPED
ncbi:MAG: hypothetical protein ACON3Z_03330 [Bradymonadia bacterium]